MNIEPGTRVRSTEPEFPHLTAGTYIGMKRFYHEIKWDGSRDGWTDLHLEDEFKVIDE